MKLYTLVMVIVGGFNSQPSSIHSVPNLAQSTCEAAAQRFREIVRPAAPRGHALCVEQAR